MANIYKNKFNMLRKNLGNYEYISEKEIEVSIENKKHKFLVYKFNLNDKIITNAVELAAKKINYTMNYDQEGKIRTNNIKLANQTKGILAEIGAQIILEDKLGYKDVKRWDLERDNFKFSKLEYDVKFTYNTKEFLCECRSSTSYKTSLSEFIESYHIIGPYTSEVKFSEHQNDFYFRPVFQYKNYNNKLETLPYEKKTETLDDLYNEKLELYFVSGATLSQMNSEEAEISNNRQNGTQYRQIRIIKIGDMTKFLGKIQEIVSY